MALHWMSFSRGRSNTGSALDAHINYTARSQFDLEKQAETPYLVKVAGT